MVKLDTPNTEAIIGLKAYEDKIKEFVKQMNAKDEKFTDKSFRAIVDVDADEAEVKEAAGYEWMRLSEIYPHQKLYGERLQHDDVRQGNVGDSYFSTALLTLMDQPQRIKRLFVQPTVVASKAGIYQVQLYINGLLTSVVVDDFVPVYKDTNKPVFCSTGT